MATSYTYDPTTGKWGTTTTPDKPSSGDKPSPTKSPESGGDSKSGDNLQSSTGDKESATGKTEQEANEIELNTLVGQLSFIATEDTIKIRAGDTITLTGIGKYLSGKYYVKEMHRQISERGYSHNATLIKTDFGDSLKSTVKKSSNAGSSSGSASAPTATTTKEEKTVQNKPQANTKGNTPTKTTVVKKGDSWASIAVKAAVQGALSIASTVAKVASTAVTVAGIASSIAAANKSAVASVNTTIAAKPVTVSKPKVGATVTLSNVAKSVATKNVLKVK